MIGREVGSLFEYWPNSPAVIIRIVLDAPSWWSISLCIIQWSVHFRRRCVFTQTYWPPQISNPTWDWHNFQHGNTLSLTVVVTSKISCCYLECDLFSGEMFRRKSNMVLVWTLQVPIRFQVIWNYIIWTSFVVNRIQFYWVALAGIIA